MAEEEFKLYNRLLLAYNDFQQASEVAGELLSKDYYEEYPATRTLVHALNLAVIVAYSRPFKISRGQLSLKVLPSEFIADFTPEEMEIHNQVIHDRDTMMAHSDADANDGYPVTIKLSNEKLVLPMNASPYAKPLLKDVMGKLAVMASSLQEKVYEKRMEIESNIIDHLPVASVCEHT